MNPKCPECKTPMIFHHTEEDYGDGVLLRKQYFDCPNKCKMDG